MTRPNSSRMRVMNHNWSTTKQRLHPQSVAETSRHSVLSGDRIRQYETSDISGLIHKETYPCGSNFIQSIFFETVQAGCINSVLVQAVPSVSDLL